MKNMSNAIKKQIDALDNVVKQINWAENNGFPTSEVQSVRLAILKVTAELDKLVSKRFGFTFSEKDMQYFWVNVKGKGTVQVKADDEGIVVDIYPLTTNDWLAPVATTYAFYNELIGDKDDVEYHG